ncbi:DUF2946 family protein [Ramlibacter alkalitolerans]|uniref:DUF2946 family protein n=1 Tax=Ramlibacter alkalitolerans TaxID=2039631 RepID=A0ABS1JI66_9BURK|nr:DUF2946 family protein [Ramlibacter alkalitolerans]MBL0423786.1 DUF2946 family protein [Ramlibacter alkalitolerans]
METLRRLQRLTCRLLLVWFALSVGVAVASPVLQPHGDDVVCSGSGALMPMPADDGGTPSSGHGHDHDCRLCVMVGAPPVPLVVVAHAAPADTPVLHLPVPVPSQAPVPFQQRGPPLL